MKKVSINTRILAIALAATFTTAFSSPALATEEKKTIPVELKFVGKIESQPVFLLSFNNAEENGYTIVVRDEFSNILYRDNVKGGNITKKFILNTEELGDASITFEVIGKKTEKTVVYEINKQSRIVEDLVINKMK
ncbi:MAG: hypothetical protein ABI675_01945 [Chitinophagaceae bacterium]